MKVFHFGTDSIERQAGASLTLGTFDGVHLGHRHLLNRVLEGKHPTVVTFEPHPVAVLTGRPNAVPVLTPLEEKLRKLDLLGVERVVVIPFTHEVAAIEAERFLREILIDTIGMNRLVVGFNHFFGKDRRGNVEFLRRKSAEYGFELVVVEAFTGDGGSVVSSTGVRRALSERRLEDANSFLGHPYRMCGTVIPGDGRGRSLGQPTANLEPKNAAQLIPAEGVYAVRVYDGEKRYDAVASIGRKTTFREGGSLCVEVHLFDFSGDLYGKSLAVEWLHYLRPQETFATAEELAAQMQRDGEAARAILARNASRGAQEDTGTTGPPAPCS